MCSLAARQDPLQGASALICHLQALWPRLEQSGLLQAFERKPIKFTRVKLALSDVAKGLFLGRAEGEVVLSWHARLYAGHSAGCKRIGRIGSGTSPHSLVAKEPGLAPGYFLPTHKAQCC